MSVYAIFCPNGSISTFADSKAGDERLDYAANNYDLGCL